MAGATSTPGVTIAWASSATAPPSGGRRAAPVAVALPAGVRIASVAARGVQSLAVDGDGQVYSWGNNDDSQLGDGSTVQRSRPVVAALPAGVRALSVSEGVYQSLVVGSDGRVYAWGSAAGLQKRPLGVTLAPGVRAVSVAARLGGSFASKEEGACKSLFLPR